MHSNINVLRIISENYVKLNLYEWKNCRLFQKSSPLKKGEILIKTEEVENYLHFIVKGVGRSYIPAKDGKEHTIQFGFKSSFFSSYASFISQTPSKTSVEALTDLTVISIHKTNLELFYNASKEGEKMSPRRTKLNEPTKRTIV